MEERLLTVDEISRLISVPVSWIYGHTRLSGSERIPHLKVGRYCRFCLADVLDWLKKQNEQREVC
jgi:excisionase family DNA binding protein